MGSPSLRAALALGLLAACGGEEAAPDLGCDGQAAYANPGPHPVGVTTLELDGVPVEVWYPATREGEARDVYDLRDWLSEVVQQSIPDEDAPRFETNAYRDVPALEGAHPLVVFSHGLGGYRAQSTFFTTHLASWGFVVAAPDHPERGIALLFTPSPPVFDEAPATLVRTAARMRAEHEDPTSPLFGRVDLSRAAVVGHSAGGVAASIAAADPAFSAWIGHAGAGAGPADAPALVIAGATDDTVPASSLRADFMDLEGEGHRYFEILGAGHLAFSDICLIAQEEGGLLPLARKYDVPVPELFEALATDGCEPGDLRPAQAWPVINHYSTAHLFAALGLPEAEPGFTEGARACFGPLVRDPLP